MANPAFGHKIKDPNEDGWPQVVTVKEIDSVAPSAPLTNQMIEIRTE